MTSQPIAGKRAPFVLAGIVVLALVAVGAARMAGFVEGQVRSADVVASCELRFTDGPNGAVQVFEWQQGELLASYPSGDGSFVRGVVRSMTRERRAREAGEETPFLLARHSDGALTISDQATGRIIVLNAFGPDNAAVFARLLDASRAGS